MATPSSADPQQEGFTLVNQTIKSLKNDKKSSDFTIKCGEQSWFAHKLVICPQSGYFSKALDGKGHFKESRSNEVQLLCGDPAVVGAVLEFLYTGDYKMSSLQAQVSIYTMADYLDIPHLEDTAVTKFQKEVGQNYATEDFAKAIEELYTSAPDHKKCLEMRKVAVQTASLHLKVLLETPTGAGFRRVLAKTPVFAAEFKRAMEYVPRYFCGVTGYIYRRDDSIAGFIQCPCCGLYDSTTDHKKIGGSIGFV